MDIETSEQVAPFHQIMSFTKSKQILSEMEKQIQEREDVEPREKDKAISIVRKVFEDTEKALDRARFRGGPTGHVPRAPTF